MSYLQRSDSGLYCDERRSVTIFQPERSAQAVVEWDVSWVGKRGAASSKSGDYRGKRVENLLTTCTACWSSLVYLLLKAHIPCLLYGVPSQQSRITSGLVTLAWMVDATSAQLA